MSNKKLSKKTKNDDDMVKLYEQQKRHLLANHNVIRNLQTQLSHLNQEYLALEAQNHQKQIQHQEMIEKLVNIDLQQTLHNNDLEKKYSQLITQRNNIELENALNQAKLRKYELKCNQLNQQREKDIDQYNKKIVSQINKCQSILGEYENSILEHQKLLQENTSLKNTINEQRESYKKQFSDQNRQKIIAIDKLKKQAIDNIRQMKKTLLSVRREQMETNTRLTVLQNHQLIQQLEYQSQNTQKILISNKQLQQKVKSLQKQLMIQKQMEQQMAIKINSSKLVIKKISEKNKQLEQLIQTDKIKYNGLQSMLSKLLLFLESQIEQEVEKKQSQIKQAYYWKLKDEENKYKALLDEHLTYQQNTKSNNQNYNHIQNNIDNVCKLLVEYYQKVLNGHINISIEGSYFYDLSRLKNIDVEQWTIEDLQLTVKILISLIKPYITSRVTKLPFIKNIILKNKLPINKYYSSSSLYSKSKNKISQILKQEKNLNPKQLISEIAIEKKVKDLNDNGERSLSLGKIVQGNVKCWQKEASVACRFLYKKF